MNIKQFVEMSREDTVDYIVSDQERVSGGKWYVKLWKGINRALWEGEMICNEGGGSGSETGDCVCNTDGCK